MSQDQSLSEDHPKCGRTRKAVLAVCVPLTEGDIDSDRVENAIRSPAMSRRNALFAGHDEGGKNQARFASLIGTCKMTGVEPYAYLSDLFTKLANRLLARDIDALMP